MSADSANSAQPVLRPARTTSSSLTRTTVVCPLSTSAIATVAARVCVSRIRVVSLVNSLGGRGRRARDRVAFARRAARSSRDGRAMRARASSWFFTHPRDAREGSRARESAVGTASRRLGCRTVSCMYHTLSPGEARGRSRGLFETFERGCGESGGVGGESVDLALGRRRDGVVERGEGEAEVVGGVGARTGARRRREGRGRRRGRR